MNKHLTGVSTKPYETNGKQLFVDEKERFWGIKISEILIKPKDDHRFEVRNNVVNFSRLWYNVVKML